MKDELKAQIEACDSELDEIESAINKLKPLDKMKAYLTLYALMRACGTIEMVYHSIVADYFDTSTITQVHTYLDKTVRDSSSSAKYDNMCSLLKKFDADWCLSFKKTMDKKTNKERLKSSLSSLVTNRHQFAHGKATTATFNDIKQYYLDALEIIQIFDSVVN